MNRIVRRTLVGLVAVAALVVGVTSPAGAATAELTTGSELRTYDGTTGTTPTNVFAIGNESECGPAEVELNISTGTIEMTALNGRVVGAVGTTDYEAVFSGFTVNPGTETYDNSMHSFSDLQVIVLVDFYEDGDCTSGDWVCQIGALASISGYIDGSHTVSSDFVAEAVDIGGGIAAMDGVCHLGISSLLGQTFEANLFGHITA